MTDNKINEEKQDQNLISEQNQDNKSDEIINEQKLDQLLIKGRLLFNESKFDEAQNIFYDALIKGIKFYKNEIAEQLAKFYYSYGNTLLAKIEEQSEFLGERVKKITNKKKDQEGEKKQLIEGVTIQEEKQNNSNQNYAQNEGENEVNNEEEDDDIEIAWENLEVARTLTEKQLESINDKDKIDILKNLAKIKLRQGDLQAINDNFDQAISEYNECLNIRMKFENNETSRELAEVYFLLGNVNLYKNEKNSEEIALEYFAKATNSLQVLLEKELNASLFTDKEKELKNKILNREPLKESFLDNPTTKELKTILNMMYDKIEDTIAQSQEKEQFEKEKQMALFSSQGFPTTKIEEKKVINLGVIKGTGGQKKVVIPTPLQKDEQNKTQQLDKSNLQEENNKKDEQNRDDNKKEEQQKEEIIKTNEDGFPEKKLKLG